MLQTEFEFLLPRGYIDPEGNLHRNGIMRLATAKDEIEPLNDPRVKTNELYLGLLMLSRVVIKLGTLSVLSPEIIEGLFASDYSYLQDLYLRLNDTGNIIETQCPNCATRFALDLSQAKPE
jgi:hypothetical protein